jgi:hypothetical protein
MEHLPTPQQLAQEALSALRSSPMAPDDHFRFLVEQGIIDAEGKVLVAKLFGEARAAERDLPASEPTKKRSQRKT